MNRISKKAVLGKGVTIGDNVRIYDNVKVGSRAFIGDNVILGEPLIGYYRNNRYRNPNTVIGPGSIIRSSSVIYAGTSCGRNFHTGHSVVIREYSTFGNFCVFGTLSQSDGYVKVGNYCRFHNNVFLAQRTEVGNYVWISPLVVTLDSLHPPCRRYPRGPRIGDRAIIGANATLLPRVNIGKGAVVAASSLVCSDVESGTLVCGSPARVVRKTKEIRCRISGNRRPYPWPLSCIKDKIY